MKLQPGKMLSEPVTATATGLDMRPRSRVELKKENKRVINVQY